MNNTPTTPLRILPYLIPPPISPHIFNFCDLVVQGTGAGGVASKIDIIPWHDAKGHELGDSLFVEGKGGWSDEVGAILGAWQRHAIQLFVEVWCNLVSGDGCQLVAGERWYNGIVLDPDKEGHKFNEALGVVFCII